jgi:hypothetical protein
MPNEPVAPGAPTIPPPYELAQYFNKVFSDRSQLNGKMKVEAGVGLMLYYLASEVARLGDLLGGTVDGTTVSEGQEEEGISRRDEESTPSESTDGGEVGAETQPERGSPS